MILEAAILDVSAGQENAFHRDFEKAQQIISAMPGYIDHRLSRCMEKPNRYLLLVHWETLEDHTIGFRGSAEYQTWKRLLHHYYDPFPDVAHYTTIFSDSVV